MSTIFRIPERVKKTAEFYMFKPGDAPRVFSVKQAIDDIRYLLVILAVVCNELELLSERVSDEDLDYAMLSYDKLLAKGIDVLYRSEEENTGHEE